MRLTHATRIGLFTLAVVLASGCAEPGKVSVTGPESATPSGTAAEARITLPFDPGGFARHVDNPWLPLVPGTVFTFVNQVDSETNTVEVMHDTKNIVGVATTVLHDQVFHAGQLSEDTFDWYGQDSAGNVWYFGEDTKTIENGQVTSTEGSWEAGKNGAKAGIIMLAHPEIGDSYQQEDAPGVVADMGKVMSLKATADVRYGSFAGVLKTAEWTPLEPGIRAFKYYVKGLGVVLEQENHDKVRVELVSVTGPGH